ncbi:MAG: hypothetical protein GC183_14680 [Thiobacillus sp.]|nr:hypothetical protein [Thiobacillus sp.]
MEMNRGLLEEASENGLLDEQQAVQRWTFLSERGEDTPSFRFTHVLYYLGGLFAIGAVSPLMTLGWEIHAIAPRHTSWFCTPRGRARRGASPLFMRRRA